MEEYLDLTIVSPDGIIFSGKAQSVEVPGMSGLFSVYPRHAAIISSLSKGKVIYVVDKESKSVMINSGFVEVLHDKVSVCVEQ